MGEINRLVPGNQAVRQQIGWIDLLRVIACFLVVVSHSCDPFVSCFGSDRSAFLAGSLTGSAVRPCVPLFAMMTGALLLPVSATGLSAFYRKRIGRIIPPLVFWSLVLPVLFFVYFTYVSPDTRNPIALLDEHQDPAAVLKKCWTFLLNFNFDTTPLWYLYMLIGMYLVMPLISPWLRQAPRRDLKLVLGVWMLSLCVPYVKLFAPMLGFPGENGDVDLWGVCTWNEFGMFYYVSGFMGYMLLAYYLMRYPLQWSWRKLLGVCIPMFVVGYAITSCGYLWVESLYPGNFAYLEIVWYFSGINVFLMTFPVFAIVQKAGISVRPWLSKLASYSFGIYLCHFVFIYVSYDVLDLPSLPDGVRILLMACLTFAISTAVVWGMWRWKVTRRFVC